MEPEATGVCCRLCLGHLALRNSHIVPEFIYGPLYDDKHRAVAMDVSAGRPTLIQKGLRERLLCECCEGHLNDTYEKPFLKLWRAGGLLPAATMDAEAHSVGVEHYATVKGFVLSVLWRADVSARIEFRSVSLGEIHRERLRATLVRGEVPETSDYPVVGTVCVDARNRVVQCVASPTAWRIHGARAYGLMLGGCEWICWVASHSIVEVDRIALGTGPALCLLRVPLHATRSLRWMRGALRRMGSAAESEAR